MLSFNNDPKIKAKYIERLKAHKLADEIVKGQYWENGKGCAVGCTIHSSKHKNYEDKLGIPEWLARLEDTIFEGLENKLSKDFPLKFLKAVPLGVSKEEFEALRHKLAIKRQQRNLKIVEKFYKKNKTETIKQVIDAIKLVISYHKAPEESLREKAYSAAYSVDLESYSVADSAVDSAAYSVDLEAYSVAESAECSADVGACSSESAVYAAELSVYKEEAKELIEGLKNLKGE